MLSHLTSSLGHDPGYGHPERADRLRAVAHVMDQHDWLGWARRESPPASDAQLLAVHTEEHLALLERLTAMGGGSIDGDTTTSAGSELAARHGAGGACALVDALVGGEVPVGAALHRPPGHHAEPDRAMGFCLYSSAAVAARWALDHHGLERVLVLDWDVHHGNGTNAALAEEPRALFVSIHESPLYPGTGPASDVGRGAGEGRSVNLPVPGGSGDEVFCSLVDHVVVPLCEAWRPQLILLSAGYDAHADDPLAGCEVTDAGYAAMTASIRRLAAGLGGVGVGVVLEGGYDLGALTRGLLTTLQVLGADEEPAVAEVAVHPLARAARGRLRRWYELPPLEG